MKNCCFDRNPTPDTSVSPQWKTTKKYPLNYLRIGNVEDTSKSLFGMEQGLLEDRATFWNLLGAHLSANSIVKYELQKIDNSLRQIYGKNTIST